jgi:hypothetical protein
MAARRLDIKFGLDMTEVARAQAKARADSKKLATDMISDVDAAEKQKLELLKLQLRQGLAASEAARKQDVQGAAQAEQQKLELLRMQLKEGLRVSEARRRTLGEEKKAQQDANEAQMESVSGFLKMGAAMIGLESGKAMVSGVVGELDRTTAAAFKTAEELFKIRGAVRELAALRGEMGHTGPTAAHVLSMQSKTLQSSEDVNAMEQSAIGIGELAIGKTISREDFDTALESVGKMATLEGGSSDAYGALLGQTALQSDHKLTPEEAQARIHRLFQIQQPGGFRNMSQAAGQFSQMNGLIMNKILSPEEAMGTLSAFSVGNAGSAGTDTQAFVRATLGGQIKARGMAVDPDLDTQKTFEYMKAIGADKTKNPIEIGKAIARDLDKHKNDAGFNAYQHLQLHGFGNQHDREAIMTFAGLTNSGQLAKIEAAQNAPLDMGKPGEGPIDRLFNERVARDPFFQTRKAEVLGQLGSTKQGLKEEPYEIARKAAFAKLLNENRMYGKYEEWGHRSELADFAEDMSMFRAPEKNSYGALRNATGDQIRREAKRLGIDESPVSMFSQETNDRDLARRVQGAGGDLSGITAKDLAAAAKDIREAAREFKAATAQKGPPPAIQGKPAQPRLRP